MQDSSLEDNEGRGDGILNRDLNSVRLVLWYRGHGQKVGRAHEEVAVERGHAQVCREAIQTWAERQSLDHILLDARTRITASSIIGIARTSPNS